VSGYPLLVILWDEPGVDSENRPEILARAKKRLLITSPIHLDNRPVAGRKTAGLSPTSPHHAIVAAMGMAQHVIAKQGLTNMKFAITNRCRLISEKIFCCRVKLHPT
jgi:hypothetical protein